MHRRYIIAFVLLAVLTGCATSKNPRQGGFFGGLYGIYSGAYDDRIQKRQDELNSQEGINQGLKEQTKNLENEASVRDLELAKEKQDVAKMEKGISRLESEINALSTKSDKQKNEIARLKLRIENQRQRLKILQSDITKLDSAGGSGADPARYQILQKERDRLALEYRRLLEYTQALSKALQ